MPSIAEIEQALKIYILEEFLPDEDEEDLTNDIELVSTGILDSVSVIKVVSHIENFYEIEIQAHEASVENMNSIESMAALVSGKLTA
ncbi:MAG: acyl carrier protein [Flavobacteriales bacterium]|jgi:acyl carrier protein